MKDMKQKARVGFVESTNTPPLSPDTITWAKNIAETLVSRDEMLTSQFVFHAGSLPEVTHPEYDVSEVYKVSVSSDRTLDPDEKLICEALQFIIKNERTQERIRNAIGYIAEYFQVIKKRRRHGGHAVTHRANLMIDGKKCTHGQREEIDIGIDRLAGDWALEMCECTTSARRFADSKIDQINFYAFAFKKIRAIVDPGVRLTMEIVAGCTTRRGFSDVNIPDDFTRNNVQVLGISLSNGHTYELNKLDA